ncbi:MAG: A/G-specific adenine glycosylase [Phocaeicola sp.]
MNLFSKTILDWYHQNKRELPWRETQDPYFIWISEIILQQTRVVQGYAYYQRFIARFPDVFALAAAQNDEVMKLWEGLGYYSRARNLHEAAKTIAALGAFPNTHKEVLALKGVGEYTAAAICSFAYNLPHAVVDGNVYRLLSRWMGIETPIDSTKGKKEFAQLAHELLDKENPGLYNQAIMEFGALQCTPASPNCMDCPLADSCVARAQQCVGELPVKQHKTKVTNRYLHYIYVHTDTDTYLRKRSGSDIWKNLYEPFLIETPTVLTLEEFYATPQFVSLLAAGREPLVKQIAKNVKHQLSHRTIYADFYEVQFSEMLQPLEGYEQIKIADVDNFAMSRLVNHFFSLLLEHNP